MTRRPGLQEDEDDNEGDRIQLPSTTRQRRSTKVTTKMPNFGEDTRTTREMKAIARTSNIDVIDINDDCKNKKGLSAPEKVQKINQDNLMREIMFQEAREECKEEISMIDENSIASYASVNVLPGAFAVHGPQYNAYNTTEDGTVQYSTAEVETAIQTQQQEEEAAEKPTIYDPLEAERVLETVRGTYVTSNQNDSTRTKWKQLTIILGIFVFMLCAVAAVLIAFFVRSNKNNNKSFRSPPLPTPPSTSSTSPVVATVVLASPTDLPTLGPSMIPSAAPTLVQQQIMTVLFEYFPDLPASNDQQEALDWMIIDPTSLGVILEEGMTRKNKKRLILERFVFATIYFATNRIGWHNHDLWLSPSFVCQWEGIECEGNGTIELQEINKVDLSNNQLIGSIPTGIGLMTSMTSLGLSENALTGSIPSELGLVTSITFLDLSYNSLSGSIPTELGLMKGMVYLNLWSNSLSVSIPTELGLMTSMTFLSLAANAISSSIPTELGLMTSVGWQDLSMNELTGSIPTELGWMTAMEYLFLDDNILTGSIPTEVGLLTRLTWLRLSTNALSSSIPTELGWMKNLEFLLLDNNILTGSIPTEVGLLTRLNSLDFSSNPNLTGTIPSEVVAILPNITFCFMGDTGLIDIPENCQESR